MLVPDLCTRTCCLPMCCAVHTSLAARLPASAHLPLPRAVAWSVLRAGEQNSRPLRAPYLRCLRFQVCTGSGEASSELQALPSCAVWCSRGSWALASRKSRRSHSAMRPHAGPGVRLPGLADTHPGLHAHLQPLRHARHLRCGRGGRGGPAGAVA